MEIKIETANWERANRAALRRHLACLRSQTRTILSEQEIDRKKTGLYLRDEVAQQLLAIHLELLALKTSARSNSITFYKEIAKTQRLVEKTVDMVLRCARELRPAILDDLGLVPALHAFLKELSKETGIRTSLTASRGLETLSSSKRIVLYRVAQKALTNVIRHAEACRVDVIIERLPAAVSMEIRDDGQGFDVKKRMANKKHLDSGLMGMRERMAMVGGTFVIESVPGHGTFILVSVPFRPAAKARVSP